MTESIGKKYRIVKAYDDYPSPFLVCNVVRLLGYPLPTEEDMRILWDEFQETTPDCDSYFGDWLVDRGGWALWQDDVASFIIDEAGECHKE